MILSPAQVEAYKRDGYIGAIDVIDGPQVSGYREAFDDLESRVGKETAQIGLIDYHFEEEFIWSLATHPAILDTIEALIWPNVLLLATHFFNQIVPCEHA